MHLLDLRDRELAPLGLEIDGLTASHAETADRAREQLHEAHADRRVGGQSRIAGEQLECEGLQRITDQQRRRLIVRLVARRPAAAQVIVVHRRQIIVHQGVNVDQLQGACGGLDLLLREPDGPGRREEQDRAHALAAAEHAVAHGGVQPLRCLIGARQPRRERRLHSRAPGFELTGERVRHGWHAGFPPGGSSA